MNSTSPLRLAVACDSRYLTGAIGTLASVRLAVPLEVAIEVIFLHDGLTPSEMRRVTTAMAKLQHSPVIDFMMVDESFADFPDFYFGSKMSYARLVLPDKVSFDRLIYIDVDMLILKNLSDLISLELPEKGVSGALEAVKPTLAQDMPTVKAVELDPAAPNLNSGLLVLDMQKVKASGIFADAVTILEKYPASCKWHDQSAVNYALNGETKVLDQSWNTQTHRSCYDPVEAIPALKKREMNIHFVSKAKPWLALSPFPAEVMFRMILETVDPRWKEDKHAKAIRAKSMERYASVLPYLFTLRAFLKKLIGKDGFFDLRAAGIWKQFNQDLEHLKTRSAALEDLYEGWQAQIDAGLAQK